MRNLSTFDHNILKSFMFFGIFFTSIALPDVYKISVSFTYALLCVILIYSALLILFHLNKITFNQASSFFVFFFFLQNLNFIFWSDTDTLLLEWLLLFPVVAYSLKRYSIISYVNIVLLLCVNILYHLKLLHVSYNSFDIFTINLEYILISVVLYALQKNKNAQANELLALNQTLEKRIQEAVEESKQREKIIQQQSRLAQMGEMLSMIAHQWRQPLSAINSATIDVELSLLSNEYDLDDVKQREAFLDYLNTKVKDVTEYVQVLSMTIDDFRNFFKPSKNSEMTVLSAPINKALKIIKTSLDDKNIEIIRDFQCEERLPLFHNEILQVILNLIKNAEDNFVETKTKNPKILIQTKKENDNFHLLIKDNGGGIEESLMDKIFDPYFSTKEEKNGTGLGLYMSKIMIEEHNNGSLRVYNEDDGVCFEIIFQTPQKN